MHCRLHQLKENPPSAKLSPMIMAKWIRDGIITKGRQDGINLHPKLLVESGSRHCVSLSPPPPGLGKRPGTSRLVRNSLSCWLVRHVEIELFLEPQIQKDMPRSCCIVSSKNDETELLLLLRWWWLQRPWQRRGNSLCET